MEEKVYKCVINALKASKGEHIQKKQTELKLETEINMWLSSFS